MPVLTCVVNRRVWGWIENTSRVLPLEKGEKVRVECPPELKYPTVEFCRAYRNGQTIRFFKDYLKNMKCEVA